MQEVKVGDEEEKKDAGLGWAKLEQNAPKTEEQPKAKPQKPSGPPIFNRSGKTGPPTFTSQRNKGIMNEEAFPELGDTGPKSGKKGAGAENSSSSKAESANIGQFGAMAQQRDGPQETKK